MNGSSYMSEVNMGLWGWGAGGFLPSYRGVGRMQVSYDGEIGAGRAFPQGT